MLTWVLLSYCEQEPPFVPTPDYNFFIALIESGVDTNNDSIISHAEAAAVTFLNVRARNISDLTGIEKFINLETLFCSDNQLLTVDLSTNSELNWLWIDDIPILHEVCVWTLPFPPTGFHLKVNGSPNAYFTTDCK